MDFRKIIGQKPVLEMLGKEVSRGALPSSLLFTGNAGIGKFTGALWLAALVNCGEKGLEPCGACLSCRKMLTGNHPDVRIVLPDAKTLNIKIDQIRELHDEADYRPLEGERKVFIVKDAHRMLPGASGAYLKLLEEPPAHILHILTAVSAHSMLDTIVSRCRNVRFSPVAPEDIRRLLLSGPCGDGERAGVLSRICQGSPGRALELAENEELGALRREVMAVMELLPSEPFYRLAGKIEQLGKKPEQGEFIMEQFFLWFRDIMFLKAGMDEKYLSNSDFLDKLKSCAEKISFSAVSRAYDLISAARKQQCFNASMPLVLDRLFMDMAKFCRR